MNKISSNFPFQKNYPSWFKLKIFNRASYLKTFELIKKNRLNTVCLSANCPNRYECFSKKTATFMILGNICTRNCLYCNIENGPPERVDRDEPRRISSAVSSLGLGYVVLTCVTRDDLKDGGAGHFAETIKEIKKKSPRARTEVLISDLSFDWKSLKKLIGAQPDVINHNIETVERCFSELRPQGDYKGSLSLLGKIRQESKKIIVKSGLMLGLGESDRDIKGAMEDLLDAGCQILTIGQYLRPHPGCVRVDKFYSPTEFDYYKRVGEKMGFSRVVSGPLVRSSYRAHEAFNC